jgi:putative ABC transport system substrate-binding protein
MVGFASIPLFCPALACAQQLEKLARLGYLSDEGPTPHLFHSHDWILDGLRQQGYIEGQNIAIEYRYAAGKAERLPSLAAELVAVPVDIIVTVGSPAARAAVAATKTIPIVMSRVGDPVAYGLVASLARPGGNATGVSLLTHDIAGKRAEILKNGVPGLTRLAILHDLTFPPAPIELKQITEAAASLKVQVHVVDVPGPTALEGAFPEVMKESPQALFVGSVAWFEDHPQQVVDFALKTRLPALYVRREFAEIGGVMSFGINYRDMYRMAADYVVKILNGEKPAELPIWNPTKVELVINLKTATALGLTMSPILLARAEDVID